LASFLSAQWEEAGSRLQLVIGGAEGIPIQLKQNSPLISLSPLTFTHQITRLILIEQLYRAVEIQKNSKYHK
jgi:23S rRNA (pseudouridine1915-N3)-methyltransferase